MCLNRLHPSASANIMLENFDFFLTDLCLQTFLLIKLYICEVFLQIYVFSVQTGRQTGSQTCCCLASHEEKKTEHHPTEPVNHPESDLEGGGRQVGDGDVLQVVLQSVDERRDGEFQSVFVLKHDGVEQEEQRLLHIACSHRERESQVTVCSDVVLPQRPEAAGPELAALTGLTGATLFLLSCPLQNRSS